MLLPSCVRVGAVTFSSPLLMRTAPPIYKVQYGRKTFFPHQFVAPRVFHDFRYESELLRVLFHQSPAALLHHGHSRPNSSLARTKASLRKGATLRPKGKSGTNVSNDNIVPVPTPSPSGLEVVRERKLKADYYEAIKSDKDLLWVPFCELKGVPNDLAIKWLNKPMGSRLRRCGIARRNVDTLHIASYVSNPDVRKKLMIWRHDTRTIFIQQFKEMLMSRAAIARLAGFKTYFELQSHFKMMSLESVKSFLEDLKSQIRPYQDAFIEDVLEQKLRDLNYHVSRQELTTSLKYHGKSIRDFQKTHKETQINLGDVVYYEGLRTKAKMNPKAEDVNGYFPLDHVITKLLPIFRDLFGMNFIEIYPSDQEYQIVLRFYLNFIKIRERDVNLRLFAVRDTGIIRRPLGYVVLDLIQRDGKPLGAFCQQFSKFKHNNFPDTPGIMLSASFPTATSKYPSYLSHGNLQTLTHELGHAIQSLARGDLNGIPTDFIEIPSMMLENWIHLPQVLQKISCHYTYLDPTYSAAWKTTNPSKARPAQRAPLDMFDHIKYKQHPKTSYSSFKMKSGSQCLILKPIAPPRKISGTWILVFYVGKSLRAGMEFLLHLTELEPTTIICTGTISKSIRPLCIAIF
ncbi:zincin [Stipitochalara longipes BDJ]|nr:zincin [Stipitochalara longipes BDJ]